MVSDLRTTSREPQVQKELIELESNMAKIDSAVQALFKRLAGAGVLIPWSPNGNGIPPSPEKMAEMAKRLYSLNSIGKSSAQTLFKILENLEI